MGFFLCLVEIYIRREEAYEEVAGTMKNIFPAGRFIFQHAGRLKNILPAKIERPSRLSRCSIGR
jgi:hypothetical protein